MILNQLPSELSDFVSGFARFRVRPIRAAENRNLMKGLFDFSKRPCIKFGSGSYPVTKCLWVGLHFSTAEGVGPTTYSQKRLIDKVSCQRQFFAMQDIPSAFLFSTGF